MFDRDNSAVDCPILIELIYKYTMGSWSQPRDYKQERLMG